ncbi:uncharacterized protein LOC108741124 isoform X2 [Agrilus planipennis]|nr:uncharacterized protein LOC108741124 isoform X2 [Agrilus planipennis]XP_018331284.1 uncharacterized protein LOC108741124 isoform X2 [Agrilus planipennis]
MYAGFVGNGMLSAAIHGEIYTSPPASEIFRLLQELSFHSSRGILLIIPNYSGERLHFALAVERAKNEAIPVKILIVDDDCYQGKPWKGRCGLSGIVLVQKIAGAMAEADLELTEIFPFCEKVVKKLHSISVVVQKPTPVRGKCVCIFEEQNVVIEFGASLNGEPGIKKELDSATEICRYLLDEITSPQVGNPIEFKEDESVVVLVNNLGTSTAIEELVFTKELLSQLYERKVKIDRVYKGKFVSSLDTAGFSVTFLKVFDKRVIEYLDAPCQVPAWGNLNNFTISPKLDRVICAKIKPSTAPVPQVGPKFTESGSNTVMMVLQFACDALYSCEKQLNTIDHETGDGDAGTRIRRGMEAIDVAIKTEKINLLYPYTMLAMLSKIIEKDLEGPLGMIYSVFLEAGSNVFRITPDTEPITPKLWSKALMEGASAVKRCLTTEAGCRTIYDPLYVCSTLLENGLDLVGISAMEAVGVSISAAEEAAQKTKMPYAKYPDPGAHSVAIWMRAVLEGLKCRWIED